MKIFHKFITLLILIGMHQVCYATFFDIQSLRIGPNPLVQGKDPIIINYVASLPHTAEYFVYTITGELVFNHKFPYNYPNVTHAGECQFVLLDSLSIGKYPKQLYVVIVVFDSGNKKIKKKKYVIVK